MEAVAAAAGDDVEEIAFRPSPVPPGNEASTLRFRLPDGSRLEETFRADAPLNEVFRYLDVELQQRKPPIGRYGLKWGSRPTVQRNGGVDGTIPLRECGLNGRVALFVSDLDR